MESRPTNKEICEILGISENEVGAYYVDSELRPDGAWLIYFGYEMPERLRGGLTGSFTLLMPAKPSAK